MKWSVHWSRTQTDLRFWPDSDQQRDSSGDESSSRQLRGAVFFFSVCRRLIYFNDTLAFRRYFPRSVANRRLCSTRARHVLECVDLSASNSI